MTTYTCNAPLRVGDTAYRIELDKKKVLSRGKCPVCGGSGRLHVNGYEMDCGYCDGEGKFKKEFRHYTVVPVTVTALAVDIYKDSANDTLYGYKADIAYVEYRKDGMHDTKAGHLADLTAGKPQVYDDIFAAKEDAENACYKLNLPEYQDLIAYNEEYGTHYRYKWPIPTADGRPEPVRKTYGLAYDVEHGLGERLYTFQAYDSEEVELEDKCPVCGGKYYLQINGKKVECRYCSKEYNLRYLGSMRDVLKRPPYTTPRRIASIRIRDLGSSYSTTYYAEYAEHSSQLPLFIDPEIETLAKLRPILLDSQAFSTPELAEAAEDFMESLEKERLDDYNRRAGTKHKWPWKRGPKQRWYRYQWVNHKKLAPALKGFLKEFPQVRIDAICEGKQENPQGIYIAITANEGEFYALDKVLYDAQSGYCTLLKGKPRGLTVRYDHEGWINCPDAEPLRFC